MRLTPKQAAGHLVCSVSMVYAFCSSNRLAHYRVGQGRGKIQIDMVDLEEFLAKCRVGPLVRPPAPTKVKLKHLIL